MKLQLLKGVEEAYSERYWRLKEGARKAIDMLCWFASERGFVFAKDEYLPNRYEVSAKTVRNVLKVLHKEAGVIFTIKYLPSLMEEQREGLAKVKGSTFIFRLTGLLQLKEEGRTHGG
ncbi:hypothetical protein [Domibacillus robiginosus]|uniref:hypothetical protein n=1 Tax=Domibacillus robiginosus TaxID=1071054 RepID=UPI00067DF496|nr:hypothetical protein [Domibacillus robiginosus]